MSEAQDSGPVRLDKWLWAARAFKTRSQAAEAIEGGHVKVNEEATKPAKLVKPGDRVEIRRE
ncbi:MAG TPA: RNA-binding S4 domain-containing protein, partial [Myxococcota bacterium]|nr:RNA-binding S4 domain-containing protein [Myxococcota bacterium]